MPPSMGGTSFPQLSGQSEMARDASLLVTRAPATTSSRVETETSTAKGRSPDEGIGDRCGRNGAGFSKSLPLDRRTRAADRRLNTDRLSNHQPLMVKSRVLLSLAPTVIVCSCVPYFSCQT